MLTHDSEIESGKECATYESKQVLMSCDEVIGRDFGVVEDN